MPSKSRTETGFSQRFHWRGKKVAAELPRHILRAMVVVVMGVSGSGKSTVGKLLAIRLGWAFRDGDEFHPAANVAKMRSGVPLNDEDRHPWLLSIQSFMRHTHADGQSAVIACSALKAAYRDLLLAGEPWVRFVFLNGSRELLAERMRARSGHFMPAALLDSQLATLEPPDGALALDVSHPPEQLTDQIVAAFGLGSGGPEAP